MAYIPPHKRHLNDTDNSSPPKPAILNPLFHNKHKPKHNLKFKSSITDNAKPQRGIGYSDTATSRWFAVGFDDGDDDDGRVKFPPSVSLQPVSYESNVGLRDGEKPLALINTDPVEPKVKEMDLKTPWTYVSENVWKDLLSSYDHMRREMESTGNEEWKATLFAKFGKIIFRRGYEVNQEESVTEDLACEEETLRKLKRTFNTSIPKSYMEYISQEGVQNAGLEFEEEKDLYYVMISDSTRCSTTCFKCRVVKDGKLELCNPSSKQVGLRSVALLERQMVMDISCLDKNVDLRLMLRSKRTVITTLRDYDMESIQYLIDSAILDGGVKGGLRWSFGNSSSGDFRVAGVWHTTTKSYVNQSMRLKIREADRFDFRTSTGEASREIIVKLKRVASELKEQQFDENAIKEMLQDDLKVLWGSFFSCKCFLKW